MKIIPFGDRIIVRRRKVGAKIGSGILHASDQTAERPTDLADVVYIVDNTFGDKAILENNEALIKALMEKAKSGDSEGLIALLRLNEYIKLKSIKIGDCVILSKYVGIDFTGGMGKTELTLVNTSDIIGIVKQ